MPQTAKRNHELLEKANNLPLCSGVYIMKDKNGKVIYVGKSRKLKNRVSQYFQNSEKNNKTYKMVSAAEDFDFIICNTEIEALTLENTLIKKYTPKYNIRLKDAKSYPYIKITDEDYPRIIFTRTRRADKAKYFGPFASTNTVYSVLDIIYKTLGIPNCKKQFPRDIGKSRPCLYFQMGKCCGLCTGSVSREEYLELIKCATDILKGNTLSAAKNLTERMISFAEQEKFESAAKCRDAISALEKLHQKQNVVASPDTEMDVFGLWQDDYCSCISCLYVRNGAVVDNADYIFGADQNLDEEAISAFFAEHYRIRDIIPKLIVTSFDINADDKSMLEEYLGGVCRQRVNIRRALRGNLHQLCETAAQNAKQKAEQSKLEVQKDERVLIRLAHLLGLESIPERIEAYDISNIGSDNITAGMVVYKNAKPSKADYKIFKIRDLSAPDDYASMKQAITRRIEHLKAKDASFDEYPDLLLVDGGKGHVTAAKEALYECEIDIPVFGMVKDDYHKTRALCTDTEEINIAKDRAIFTLIYKIQDEVHRFTVTFTQKSKSHSVKHSILERIDGIGPAKAKKILAHFKTITALKEAEIDQIAEVEGIGVKDASAIYTFFRRG